MKIEEVFESLNKTEQHISDEIRAHHPEQVHLVEGGIAIILDGITIAGEVEIDLKRIDQYILRRYLFVIPFRANWAYRSLIGGFPSTSYSLIRVLLEELVSMHYYGVNLDAARSAFSDPNYDEPGFSKKINSLAKNHPFLKIATTLSDGYIHPALVKPIFSRDEENGVTPEPFYNIGATNYGFDLLITFLEIAVVSTSVFDLDTPEFHEWRKNANLYLADTGAYRAEREAIVQENKIPSKTKLL